MASSSRGGGTPGRVNCLATADRVTLSSGTAFSPLNTSQFPHAKNTSQNTSQVLVNWVKEASEVRCPSSFEFSRCLRWFALVLFVFDDFGS